MRAGDTRGRDRNPRGARGGTGRGVAARASRRAGCRDVQWPRGCRRSRKDENGSARRAAGSRRVGRSGSGRLRCRACCRHFSPQNIERRAQRRIRGVPDLRTGADDHVDRRQSRLMQPERLTDDPADPITFHRVAGELDRDREAEPRMAKVIGPQPRGEAALMDAPPARAQRLELARLAQSRPRRQPESGPRRRVGIGGSDRVSRRWAGSRRERYGISFLRPLARRRASTLRPFLVAMRARKPCVFLRRTLLG